jgi:hypothetical protein
MRRKLVAACSTLTLLIGIGWYSVVHAQDRREPHMTAALEHLQAARAELERASHNKGGHRERALGLVDQAIRQVQEGEAYYERGGR